MLALFHPELHPVFETLGYAGGFAVYRSVRSRQGNLLNNERRWMVIAATAVGALLGELFSTNHSPQSRASTLRELLCCLPQVHAPQLGYNNLFRILIVAFIDAQSFDLRSIKKTGVHIAHPGGKRLIPFDTYNMFYRDDLEQTRLEPLCERTLASA